MSERPSARIPLPGPVPETAPRTAEQRAALWTGALLLLACLLSVDLTWRVLSATQGVVASLIPVAWLAGGWLVFLLGLIKLSGDRLRSSQARGPWLIVGLGFFLFCAPLAGSFTYAIDEQTVTFRCSCGAQVRAEQDTNCWGLCLRQDARVLIPGRAGGCAHLRHAPW